MSVARYEKKRGQRTRTENAIAVFIYTYIVADDNLYALVFASIFYLSDVHTHTRATREKSIYGVAPTARIGVHQ